MSCSRDGCYLRCDHCKKNALRELPRRRAENIVFVKSLVRSLSCRLVLAAYRDGCDSASAAASKSGKTAIGFASAQRAIAHRGFEYPVGCVTSLTPLQDLLFLCLVTPTWWYPSSACVTLRDNLRVFSSVIKVAYD